MDCPEPSALAQAVWRATGTLASARRHKVSALLHLVPPEGLSADEAGGLRDDFRRTLAQNLIFLSHTQAVEQTLHEAGIASLPLKGALFASRFYPHLGARPQSDVDVLVYERDLIGAHEALLRAGWSEAAPRAFYVGHYHWVYREADTGCLLELHWRFKPSGTCAPDVDAVWRGASAGKVEGVRCLQMRPEDLLEYMAVNKAIQHYSTLLDLVDLFLIIEKSSLDWDYVVASVRANHTAGAVWFGLSHAAAILGARVPESALRALAGSRASIGARCLSRWLAKRGGPLAVRPELLEGPAGRVYEALLEGRCSGAARVFVPLLAPSQARLDVLAQGSYPRYVWNNLLRLCRQLAV